MNKDSLALFSMQNDKNTNLENKIIIKEDAINIFKDIDFNTDKYNYILKCDIEGDEHKLIINDNIKYLNNFIKFQIEYHFNKQNIPKVLENMKNYNIKVEEPYITDINVDKIK